MTDAEPRDEADRGPASNGATGEAGRGASVERTLVPLTPCRPWQVVPGVPFFSFYTLAVIGIRVLLRLLTRCEVVGRENIPTEGPIVVVSNHVHFADPPILGATIGRKVALMAKSELFSKPIIGWIVRHYHAFPVRRGAADRQALRDALLALKYRLAVAMFPEGTRSRNGVLREAHPGAALIALRGQCPIVPLGIDGSDRIFPELRRGRRARLRVVYGKPFTINNESRSPDRLGEATELMMARVAELVPEWRRGRFARSES